MIFHKISRFTRVLSSTFSVSMLNGNTELFFRSLTEEQFMEELKKGFDRNVLNPRHESTCALVKACGIELPAEGGFLEHSYGMTIIVVLPGKELMNREGTEVELSDLGYCAFWKVCDQYVINREAEDPIDEYERDEAEPEDVPF